MKLARAACGPFFVLAGAMHFVVPGVYERIVPRWLPAPRALVYLSGVAEAAGGAALIPRATRRWAGWWLVATLIAVYPANVDMALHPERHPQVPGGRVGLLARLPFQAVFIWWVMRAAQGGGARTGAV
jgi:uncharacterized membrane protein